MNRLAMMLRVVTSLVVVSSLVALAIWLSRCSGNPKTLSGLPRDSNETRDNITRIGCASLFIPATTCIAIQAGKGRIEIYYDGTVKLPEGISLSDDARLFWEAIGEAFPEFKKSIITRHEVDAKPACGIKFLEGKL